MPSVGAAGALEGAERRPRGLLIRTRVLQATERLPPGLLGRVRGTVPDMSRPLK